MQRTVGLQLLQHAACHLAGAAHQTGQFLARHAQLGTLRMAHRLRLAGQIVQGAHDAVGDVQEGQPAGFPAGIQQPARKLSADGVEQLGRIRRQRAQEQLVQALVADLGQFALGPGPQDDFPPVGLDEQAHLADELAAAEIAEHQLAVVIFFRDDAHGTADHIVECAGGIPRAEHIGPSGIAPAMAVGEETLDRGCIRRQRAGGGASGGGKRQARAHDGRGGEFRKLSPNTPRTANPGHASAGPNPRRPAVGPGHFVVTSFAP